MNSKKDIDMLIDPPEFCEGKEAWVRWRKGLEKDDPEIPAIADAIKEADEVIQWYEQEEMSGGESDLDSALTVLPSLKHDTSSAPRMLTPSERDWLRRNKKAATKRALELIAESETRQTED